MDSSNLSKGICFETNPTFKICKRFFLILKPFVEEVIAARPVTSKPRDPDSYDFNDEQLARDYRKMYEKYHQVEALLKSNKSSGD